MWSRVERNPLPQAPRQHWTTISLSPRSRSALRSLPITIPESEAGNSTGDLRHRMISEAAYQLYAQRGYVEGSELTDRLQAEAESV